MYDDYFCDSRSHLEPFFFLCFEPIKRISVGSKD